MVISGGALNILDWFFRGKSSYFTVGKPILVEKDENPTQDKINGLHQTYMDELEKLFDENKAKYGYEHQTIQFID